MVARRMKTQIAYKPVFEDWLFHVALLLASYALLAVAPFGALTHETGALFAVAGAIGIHNAWDAVSYHVFVNIHGPDKHEHHQKNHDKNKT
jgi:hypothetical protein